MIIAIGETMVLEEGIIIDTCTVQSIATNAHERVKQKSKEQLVGVCQFLMATYC